MSWEDRHNNIAKTTVTLKNGSSVSHQQTYHYINQIGALIVRDRCDGNVASYPAGEWTGVVTK